MAKRRKCYFDIMNITQAFPSPGDAGTSRFSIVRPTQQNATTPSTERYGGFLDDVAALTGGSPPEVKRRNAVSAWFQPRPGYSSMLTHRVEFVGVAGTVTAATPLPFLLPGGGVDLEKAGADAIYTRHFRVRLQHILIATVAAGPTIGTVRGTLYLQRQHSIEV
jgi:hypothetical protein